jgi:hypothetical protein
MRNKLESPDGDLLNSKRPALSRCELRTLKSHYISIVSDNEVQLTERLKYVIFCHVSEK